MPANLENSAVATGLEKVSFHSNPKEMQWKECSTYRPIALISHASKVMLKILQARLQQAGFRKGFGIVNKAEIDIFLELSCFFDDPADVSNLISGSSAFSKSILNIWKFSVYILLKPSWRILSITLLACEMTAIVL